MAEEGFVRGQAVVASVEIAADPYTVYRIVTDFARRPRFVAETRAPAAPPQHPAPGLVFRAWNRNGPLLWRTTSEVVIAEPGRCLAFRVTLLGRPVAVWRYGIVATARGRRATARGPTSWPVPRRLPRHTRADLRPRDAGCLPGVTGWKHLAELRWFSYNEGPGRRRSGATVTTAASSRELIHPVRDAIRLEAVLHALSDPMRLRVVRDLSTAEDELSCSYFDLPVTKSTTTHHFRVLRESGVIQQTYRGTAKLNGLRRADLDALFPGLLDSVLGAAARQDDRLGNAGSV